jgi:predicted naringenin-chalcone synthase
MGDDLSLIISNALFSDGAAAAVLWDRPAGLELVASASRFLPEYRDHIRYVHRGGQLHNHLSLELPQVIRKPVAELATELLRSHGLGVGDAPHWAMHSGGDKVVNALAAEIGLSEEQAAPTRRVLAEYGNISSPTVWFVLRDIVERGMKPGDWVVMLAFGAGFSAHCCLLRAGSVPIA